MLKGKQRSYLKKLAHDTDPIFQIGKAGVNDNFIEQLKDALEARELVKITVLDNSDLDTKEAASIVAEKSGAEFVQAIGKKFVIYKESEENKKIKLPKA